MLSTQVTTKKTPSPAKGPRKSRFAEVGREAARKAQRQLVLDELKRHDWNLTDTAKALGLAHASAVSRAIDELDLADEYEQGKAAKNEREKAAKDAVEQKS